MKNSDRLATIRAATIWLQRATIEIGTTVDGKTVIDRMREAQGGMRAQRTDLPRPAGTPMSDPTAANGTARRADVALGHERELDRMLEAVLASSRRIIEILQAYPPARVPSTTERLRLADGNRKVAVGCESCSKINGSNGSPRFEEIHPKLTGPTDVRGRLAKPLLLCRWCYDAVEQWGRLPTNMELERHHRGERVSWPKDVAPPL